MDNIIHFPGTTKGRIDPQDILAGAQQEGLKMVVVLGYDANDEEYFASSTGDAAEIVLLLQRMNLILLSPP